MQLEDLRQRLTGSEGSIILLSAFYSRVFPFGYNSNEARVILASATSPFADDTDSEYDFVIVSRRIFQVNGIFVTKNGDYILIPNAYEKMEISPCSLHKNIGVRRHELTGEDFSEKVKTPFEIEVERRLVFSEFLVGEQIKERRTRLMHPKPEYSGCDFLDRIVEEMFRLR